ncbi:MAG: gliding motility-associated C-terminal domain-containing protein, partial [Bacteroidetes bacterium]|nr:gliding motility-associated C-terminal domain-containing protein [Bacteroidota bacterium]
TWNPGVLTGTAVAVIPSVTTTYTVDGDNGLGCISSETITIAVNAAPSISLTASSLGLCTPAPVTLTASGASTYTWNPTALTTATIVDTPTLTTTYTVTGTDAIGCSNTETITISVGNPTLSITSNPSVLCVGATATLTANGAASYTWSPLAVSGTTITDAPSVTTTYTVTGDNGFGCVTTDTFVLTVTNGPTLTAVASPTTVCSGSTVSLTASGATNYTWMPMSVSGASVTDTPITSTTYTVSGDNGGCVVSTTVFVNVSTGPASVTAIANNTITCSSPTISLTGNSTTSGVVYSWSGPNSYTSAVQSPTDIIAAGDYTLSVSDPLSGCATTATTTVVSNTVAPVVGIIVPGPVLGCNATVTLAVVTSPTIALTFDWSGPSSFTSSVQSPTTSVAGDYTVVVTDPVNGCQNVVSVTVGSSTVAPVYSATIVPATCSGTFTNNDGTILISGNSSTDTYDISQSATYTGTANYSTASTIPFSGILTNTLVNPSSATPYTIRVFGNNGCFTDMTLTLTPTSCSTTVSPVLGITKAVSTPTLVNNNTYNVTYTIVATNTSTVDLVNMHITDNLNATFPLPTTFSVISPPVITSINSSLNAMSSYDGNAITELLGVTPSTLTAGKADTIVFTVQIHPNGFFGPYNNSAVGIGTDNNAAQVSDSSNTGFIPDPDNDGNPTNNNIPTSFSLTPHSSLGVAKSGTVSGVLADKTLDVTYVITVKNLGNDTIRFVQVLDSLVIPSPATFTIKSAPTASGSLTANSNYNGNSDIGLLVASSSKLAPGETETITFVLNVTPNDISSITNTAIGAGFATNGSIVRDSSNTGTEPDPNGNGDATEQGENAPTILELPDVNLFVPQVFTPDGDGKNDFFVIKGIEGRVVNLTVFNRWGNKVYQNSAYDNTWNGTPNVSGLILGNSKLPQGTYYYIVEFEDGADKAINGYVVLQY